jgi:hypothetical protein
MVNLTSLEPKLLEGILKTQFNKPQNDGRYGVYIIDERMGTGTDFKSSSIIEVNGGVSLIVGIVPTCTSTFEQINSRTGRIFNKGTIFYVFNDHKSVGLDETYLQTAFEVIRTDELLMT